jgi:hypothetical protein
MLKQSLVCSRDEACDGGRGEESRQGWRNKTWRLHHNNAPAHTALLVPENLAKHKRRPPPQNALLSIFGPCRLTSLLDVQMHSQRSPISDDRIDRSNFSTGTARVPANTFQRIIDSGGETGGDGDNSHYVRFEVFTAVTMKNGVFWDVTPCGSCENRRFGGT